MKTKTILASLAAFFAGLAICLAADPNMLLWSSSTASEWSQMPGRGRG